MILCHTFPDAVFVRLPVMLLLFTLKLTTTQAVQAVTIACGWVTLFSPTVALVKAVVDKVCLAQALVLKTIEPVHISSAW